ncbi:MAG: hypothetical protein FJ100_19860 [Deltaproteobacteria bacterium]|nr:hypothetical protein [Deltaproteobacteria bacterium]
MLCNRPVLVATIGLAVAWRALWGPAAAADEPPAHPRATLQASANALRQKARTLRGVAHAERKRCATLRKADLHPCTLALAEAIASVEAVARATDDLGDRVADRLAAANDPVADLAHSQCAGGDTAACERVRAADLPLEGFRKMFVAPAEERLSSAADAALRALDRARGDHRATAGKMPQKASDAEDRPALETQPTPAKVQDDRKVGNEALPAPPTPDAVASCRKGDVPACRATGERLLVRRDPAGALALFAHGCAARDAGCCASAGIAADQLALLQPAARSRQAALGWHDKACALRDRGGCHRAAGAVLAAGKDIGRGVRLALAACELGECADCRALAGTLVSNLTAAQRGKVRGWAKGCP